jgi:hypothetical protein
MKIKIGPSTFTNIQAYKTAFDLSKDNVRVVRCSDCRAELRPGLGIFRRAYRHNGYICFACFAKGLPILTFALGSPDNDAGFSVDLFSGSLRACRFDRRKYSTAEIVEAVYNALLDEAYTSIDILLGAEGPGILKIGDLAEILVK